MQQGGAGAAAVTGRLFNNKNGVDDLISLVGGCTHHGHSGNHLHLFSGFVEDAEAR